MSLTHKGQITSRLLQTCDMEGFVTDTSKQNISMAAGNLQDSNVRRQSHHLPSTNINQWQLTKCIQKLNKQKNTLFQFRFSGLLKSIVLANSSISRHGYSLSNIKST